MSLYLTRRTRAKGRWMKLRDPELLGTYMGARDFTNARLGRYASVSRQFIWALRNDPLKQTCTPEVARRIEEALSVLPGTLFVAPVSTGTQCNVARKATPRSRKRVA